MYFKISICFTVLDWFILFQDFYVYKKALFCCQFPVLCAPDPPPENSPPLPVTSTFSTSLGDLSGFSNPSFHSRPPNPPFHSRPLPPGMLTRPRSLSTNESMSFVSEPDDLSMSLIPIESLCELLRQAFGLSRQWAAQYEKVIFEPYRKKTHAKVPTSWFY